MKHRKNSRGFTLIELLVVISIIGILASMLIPALSRAKLKAQVARAQMEAGDLANAIRAYYSEYSRYPLAKPVRDSLGEQDYTYGTRYGNGWWNNVQISTPGGGGVEQRNNSDVIAALMAIEQFPNNQRTVNADKAMNPRGVKFLNAKMVQVPTSPNQRRQGGVGQDDLLYCDPWGNPYIITVDADFNGECVDGFYRQPPVSADPKAPNSGKGLEGLFRKDNVFAYRGEVMVWSMGPDGKVDANVPANTGVNKDNVLSWR